MAYGPCDGPLVTAPFVESIRATELDHYVETFQSFTMDTPDGFVNLSGLGDTKPSASQQRSVAAWAKLVSDETSTGRLSAAEGLVIGWRREGGLAGFCDDLLVYATGAASASSCRNGQAEDLGQIWLDSNQLVQLYGWIDSLGPFEYAPQSDATADTMTINLVFTAQGTKSATESDQQAIEAFAAQLYDLSTTKENQTSGTVNIEGVEVTSQQVTVHGKSSSAEGSCVSTELLADNVGLTWWPDDACAPVTQAAWELVVPLDSDQTLQPGRQYIVRAYQSGEIRAAAVFPFDLDGPPTPN